MSVLNFDKKILFVHVPKTAGTSMEAAPFIGLHGHIPYVQYEITLERGCVGGVSLKEFFKFAFVRNPYDRFVSSYFHCRKMKFIKPWMKLADLAKLLPKSCEMDFTSLRDKNVQGTFGFTPQNPLFSPKLKDLFYPQSYYLMDSDSKCGMDFVGRFENLQEDWDRVCKKVGEKFKLPHLKKTKHRDYREYYKDIKTLGKVEAFYKKDFDMFYSSERNFSFS